MMCIVSVYIAPEQAMLGIIDTTLPGLLDCLESIILRPKVTNGIILRDDGVSIAVLQCH